MMRAMVASRRTPSHRRLSRAGLLLALLALMAAAAWPSAASARSSSCSASGDVCLGATGSGSGVRLQITLAAHYFDRYQLCVRAPGGRRTCHRFRVQRAGGGTYASTVRWARRFPDRGPGTYRARWRSGGRALGPAISFRQA
jgi:hypothetical protein